MLYYITHDVLCYNTCYITDDMLCYITHDILYYITHYILCYITHHMLCYISDDDMLGLYNT